LNSQLNDPANQVSAVTAANASTIRARAKAGDLSHKCR